MRHRRRQRKLGRTSEHRSALFRNQLASMVRSERIVTTLAKAKELRPIIEKMVTLAKDDTLHHRRKAASSLSEKSLVKRLFDEIGPRFSERPGGYTRIIKLGPRRGDGAEMAILEFVDYQMEGEPEPAPKKTKKAKATKKTEEEVEADEAEELEEAPKKSASKKPSKKASSKKSSTKKPSSTKAGSKKASSKKSSSKKSSTKSASKKSSKKSSKKKSD